MPVSSRRRRRSIVRRRWSIDKARRFAFREQRLECPGDTQRAERVGLDGLAENVVVDFQNPIVAIDNNAGIIYQHMMQMDQIDIAKVKRAVE